MSRGAVRERSGGGRRARARASDFFGGEVVERVHEGRATGLGVYACGRGRIMGVERVGGGPTRRARKALVDRPGRRAVIEAAIVRAGEELEAIFLAAVHIAEPAAGGRTTTGWGAMPRQASCRNTPSPGGALAGDGENGQRDNAGFPAGDNAGDAAEPDGRSAGFARRPQAAGTGVVRVGHHSMRPPRSPGGVGRNLRPRGRRSWARRRARKRGARRRARREGRSPRGDGGGRVWRAGANFSSGPSRRHRRGLLAG